MKRILTWLGQKLAHSKPASGTNLRPPRARINPARVGGPPVARNRPVVNQQKVSKPDTLEYSHESIGGIEDGGPGKNVLIRNRFIREDTGTHETLKIINDSILESDEPDGIDPYNTGRFDRSKHWDGRSRN